MAENQTVYQTELTNKQIFNGMNSFGSDDIAYHSISTDHPYMRDIGLSVFTTGQLYQWMSYRDYTGEFINLKYFNGLNSSPLNISQGETVASRILYPKLATTILGTKQSLACPEDYNTWMGFGSWRRQGKSGQYKFSQLFGWTYYNKYAFSDIGFNTFSDYKIELKKQSGQYDSVYDIVATPSSHIDEIVSILITLNDQSRFLPILRDFYKKDVLPKPWLAAYELISDIKSSQQGCISWKSYILFDAYVGSQRCTKQECVNFTLHLYDETNRKSPNRPIALNSKNLFISLPQQDVFGREISNDGTGEVNFSTNQNSVVAQLSLQVNPSDGKAYSGSPMVLVKLVDTLPSATWQNNDNNVPISENLMPDKNNQHIPGTGTAIPLTEQNGNALQWAASYKHPKCIRAGQDSAYEKFTIILNNHYNSSFPAGTIGYATKLNGETLWSFVPIGTYDDALDTRPQNWSFTYLMMNADNFFTGRPRLINPNSNPGPAERWKFSYPKFLTPAYEDAVAKYYYADNTVDLTVLDNFPPVQITSWDFMDSSIGGLRDGNSLSTTVFNLDNDGAPWEDYENGKYSTPFFGCVFPDGYALEKNYYQAIGENVNISAPTGDPFTIPAGSLNSYTDNQPFIKPVSRGTILFDNAKNDSKNRTGDFNRGMFYDGPLKNTLNHLPADIGMNASPFDTSTIGGPIVNYYHIYRAFQISNGDGNPYTPNPSIPIGEAYQSMIKNIVGSGTSSSNYYTKLVWAHPSGFSNKSTFGFKPLNPYKIQFRPLKHEVYDCLQGINGSIANSNFDLGRWARSARNYQASSKPPFTDTVWRRNSVLSHVWRDDDYPGLSADLSKYGMLIDTVSTESSTKTFRYNKFLASQNRMGAWGETYGPQFPKFWADFNWLSSKDIGAGAFGVIGVSCTMSFLNKITFNTNCVIGMRSSFGATNVTQPTPWYQAFGGAGNNYNSFNNTQLWVRIYHHWPKEYTIYDPAKFAVFHFNTEEDDKNIIDWYVPAAGTAINIPICSDFAVYNGSSPFVSETNSKRKAKLLPYKYKLERTIGIPISNVWVKGANNANPSTTKHYDIAIDNQGFGYLSTDLFTIAGGNGTSPILKPVINNGQIVGFEYQEPDTIGRGYNYLPTDFLSYDTDFSGTGGLEIVPQNPAQHAGKNFTGRVVRGFLLESPIFTDSKPKSIGPPFIQLTPNVPVRTTPNESIMEPLTDANTISAQLNPESRSADNKYDLFFHFHNDTSHTLIDDYGSAPIEQYVELTISPD